MIKFTLAFRLIIELFVSNPETKALNDIMPALIGDSENYAILRAGPYNKPPDIGDTILYQSEIDFITTFDNPISNSSKDQIDSLKQLLNELYAKENQYHDSTIIHGKTIDSINDLYKNVFIYDQLFPLSKYQHIQKEIIKNTPEVFRSLINECFNQKSNKRPLCKEAIDSVESYRIQFIDRRLEMDSSWDGMYLELSCIYFDNDYLNGCLFMKKIISDLFSDEVCIILKRLDDKWLIDNYFSVVNE